MAGLVVGDEPRNTHASRKRRVRCDPSPPRVGLVRRVDDADERAVVGEVDPEVAPPPDVADERLDRGRRADRAAGQRLETGGVGREQRR
jgi:hypothetical protein